MSAVCLAMIVLTKGVDQTFTGYSYGHDDRPVSATVLTIRNNLILVNCLCIFCLAFLGCRSIENRRPKFELEHAAPPTDSASYNVQNHAGGAIDYDPSQFSTNGIPEPLTNRSQLPEQFRELTLDEAISIALQNSEILRSLSATVVQSTQGVNSSLDPAIQSTDPNFGIEAALSAFDTTLNSSIQYSNNDDTFNNSTTTGLATVVQQDLTDFRFGLNKTTAAGTQFSLDSSIIHDNSTNPALLFPSVFDTTWQASVRQPLLQGSGTLFNRTVGPLATAGFNGSSGFLISRSNHDISIAEFERNIKQMMLEIINAYWQLDLAFGNFQSIKASRDASQETWNISKARLDNGLPGGEADREAQARAQFYQFESQLRQSLNGTLQAEADLRRLLGLPQSDGTMLKPTDQPSTAQTVFDWNVIATDAVSHRVEIRQQSKRIEQRELFLLAARNFTRPRLDAIATYRNNGFGDNLFGDGGQFSGAFNEALAGNFDEWEVGLTLDVPLGFRQGYAGVRNAELQLRRERALLHELREQILHDLGTALRSLNQSQDVVELTQLRANASAESEQARNAAYKADAIGFEDLLDAQQNLLNAQLDFHVAETDYELALAQVLFESSHLLEEYSIRFNEETPPPSPLEARRRKILDSSVRTRNLEQHGFLK